MKEKKKLCKLVKDNVLDKNMDKYLSKIDNPEYVCKSCGRVANKKNILCKSYKI